MRLLGIDIGGTFTDTVLIDGDTIHAVKTKSTEDLITGISRGIREATDRAGITPDDIDIVSHGSTIAVNALIEKKGAKTAIIGTEGFRDILEIGEGFRDASLLYNPCGDHEAPLIPRRYRYGVAERMNAQGTPEEPLDHEHLDEIIDELEEAEMEAVAVSLLHSYRNSEHEHQIKSRIEERLPHLDVSISAEVSPEIREYSRTSTTAVDAYIKPKVSSYLDELETELRELGISSPINIMKSDGGLARPNIASKRPVTQIISGPVAGVKAGQYIGEKVGASNVLTLDMGGTSCDTAMIENGSPVEVSHRDVHGLKINGPFTNINTVGAGGGSIAWLDEVNALRVGPESAGAEPGPVCYGRGGTQPTVTDADLLLGLLNPDNFAGGSMALDVEGARDAIRTEIAVPLDMTVEEAAVAIRDIIDSKMASAIRVISVNEGIDPREFSLMGFGGAGPMHACNVADELDIDEVVVPSNPGVHSSTGLLVSNIRHEYTRSLVETVDEADPEQVTEIIDGMIEQGTDDLSSEQVAPEDRSFTVSFDMMYSGQAHYLNLMLEETELTTARLDDLVSAFETEHEKQYGFTDEQNPIELVNVRVSAVGDVVDPEIEDAYGTAEGTSDAALKGERPVVIDRETVLDTPYYDWELLGPSHTLDGPAIIEMDNSMIWLPPTFDARIDEYQNIIASKNGGDR